MRDLLQYLRRRDFIARHLREKSLRLFVKTTFRFLMSHLFTRYKYFVFVKNKKTKIFKPKVKHMKLKIITSKEQLTEISKQFDITYLLDREINLEEKFKNSILFCVFVGGEIAHTSWVMIKSDKNPLPSVNLQREVFIHRCTTVPRYRGLGLYTYTLCKIFEYARKLNKIAKIDANVKNISSIKGILKAGFEVYAEGDYFKFLGYERKKEIKKLTTPAL